MYILTGGNDQIINTDFVERFCVATKEDAALIVASYSTSRPPVTMGRYSDAREAHEAINDLFGALSGGLTHFAMPESSLYANEVIKRDARTKRKGGS